MKLPMKGQLYRALLKARGKRVTDTDVRYSRLEYTMAKIGRELNLDDTTVKRWNERWFNDPQQMVDSDSVYRSGGVLHDFDITGLQRI